MGTIKRVEDLHFHRSDLKLEFASQRRKWIHERFIGLGDVSLAHNPLN